MGNVIAHAALVGCPAGCHNRTLMASDPLNSPSLQDKALLGLVLAVTVLFGVVLWPMAGAVSWAVFIAIVFSSLQERSVQVLHGRRGWAALATLLVIVVSVLLPMALLA